LPRGLLLKGSEGPEVAVGLDDLLHANGAECTDQLVLQIRHARVETEPLHGLPCELRSEPGPLEAAPEVVLLRHVEEAGEPDVEPPWAEPLEEPPDCLRTADRHDRDSFGGEIPPTSFGERFDGAVVADPLDEDDGAQVACVRGARSSVAGRQGATQS